MMEKFLQLLEDSVILQAILTVLVWGTIAYLVIAGRDVAPLVHDAGLIILGYYFGSKTAQAVMKALR